jgi:hypothetical protein
MTYKDGILVCKNKFSFVVRSTLKQFVLPLLDFGPARMDIIIMCHIDKMSGVLRIPACQPFPQRP